MYEHGGVSVVFLVCANDFFKILNPTDVNLLSKLSIIFKEWRVIVLLVLLRSHRGQAI
jgi:hypothetical protein